MTINDHISCLMVAHEAANKSLQFESFEAEKVKGLLPFKLGSVVKDHNGKDFEVRSITYTRGSSVGPYWTVRGGKMKKDGTPGDAPAVATFNLDGTSLDLVAREGA